jgi:flavodoxin
MCLCGRLRFRLGVLGGLGGSSVSIRLLDIPPPPVYNRAADGNNKGAAVKTILVYSSKHHMNTEKVAQAIAAELKVEACKVTDVMPADLDGFDLVGFGSGINAFDVHPEMHALVDGLGEAKGRKVFLFSTCASRKVWTGKLRGKLVAKGFSVVDEFCCPGLWTPGLLKVRNGHPSAEDLDAARTFARKLPTS